MTDPLREGPEALRLRVLRRFYREGAALAGLHPEERELSRETSGELNALLQTEPGAGMNLPGDLRALRGQKLLHLLRIKRTHISLIYDPLRDRIDRLAAFRHDTMETILILVHKGLPEHPRCTLEQRKCIQSIYPEMREYRRMCAASMENEFLVNETCQR